MSDPFDFLNPIASTKTPAAQPHHAPVPAPVAPMNVNMGMGMNMGMSARHGQMNMGMGMPQGNMGMTNMNMAAPAFNGGMNMNMGGMNVMGGQFPGAGMGPGMTPPNPFGQQQQQPVMYDSIKKLMEKKPVVDDASMDFLEGLGGDLKASSTPAFNESATRAPEPVQNPFGAPQAPADLDFSFLGGGGAPAATPASPASGAKSSALASRLAHGKRPTQEAARKNLGFNAGAFATTTTTPKISLKTVAGGSTSSITSDPTVDDFASGNALLSPKDDSFAPAPTAPTTQATNDIFW